MASGSGPQETSLFPIRSPRPTRRASPYPSNPPTHARNTPVAPDPMPAESAPIGMIFAEAIPSAALQSKLAELKKALSMMKTSLSGLPPLRSAIDRLEGCFTHIQIWEQTQHEYEEIVSGLTNLTNLIQTQVIEKNPSYVPHSVANIARAIEEQANGIRERQRQSRINSSTVVGSDIEAVLKHYRGIVVLFRRLQTNVSMSTWDVSQEQQMSDCLKLLQPAHGAYHDAAISGSATKRAGCTEGTRVELLETAQTWVQEEGGVKIYWLNGIAGTGKTTIAYSLCEMLQEKHQLGGSFFCSRNLPDCRDVNRIIPTIAYQLGRYSNSYRKALCDVLRNDPDVAKRNIRSQFKLLILGPTAVVDEAMPSDVVVVIDALDECKDPDGTRDMLDMLLQFAGGLPIRFFISSRPEPEIFERMTAHDGAMRSIVWLHDIEKSLVQADIELYLTEALKSVRVSSSEISQLTAHAGCLFIFAATAVRYILPAKGAVNRRQRIQAVLGLQPNQKHKSHQDIDKLYTTILSNALDETVYEEEEITERRQVLWTVICAREPLSVQALGEILDTLDEETVELAIQSLQSVLHVSGPTNVVSALHASFPDFLLNEHRAGQFYCNEVAQHSYLVNCCFGLMSQALRFNICGLESSHWLDREAPNLRLRVDKAISTGLFYSCRYWSDHLTMNPPTPLSLSLLESFLRSHLLFWMEVLNLKGAIGHGESELSQALEWLPMQDESTGLRDLTYDARNFLTSFAANPTSLSTPHIYISTLPFTSKQSLVYQTYWPRTQGLIRVEGRGMEARGKSALAVWVVGSDVKCLALSNDSKRVVSGSRNNEVSVWDISSGTRILGPLEGHTAWVWSVAYSPDNSRIASGSWDKTIRIWHAQKGELITGPLLGHSAAVRAVAFLLDGARLASVSKDGTVRIWDADTGAPVGDPLEEQRDGVMPIAFSPDGQSLASGSFDLTIRVWEWQKSAMAQVQLKGHTAAVCSLAYANDGRRLASGSLDETVRVWDMSNGALLAGPFEGHTNTVSSVCFSPNGTRVVSGSWDQTIRVWEAMSGRLVAGPFEGHGDYINSVLFTADGTRILSGSDDRTIRVWDVRHGITSATKSSGHTAAINSVASSPDGTRAASASRDETICVWDTCSGALVAGPFRGHTHSVNSVAFSPDGARIVSGSDDRTLRTWDAATGDPLVGPIEGHISSVLSVALSPDGSQIASGSEDTTIRLWNSHTGKSVAAPFRGHTEGVTSIAFSPDGARIVSGSDDNTVRMWATGDTSLWTSDAHTKYVRCVAFSPDGTRVVSGSWDKTILVLDAGDGAVLHGPFTGHNHRVSSVAFSPNGTCVVSGSRDGTVHVWHVESGTMVTGPLNGHTDEVRSVVFSPNGARIFSGSDDHTVRVWDLAATAQASPSDNWSIDGDGWLTDSHSQRLFWVPLDLRTRFGFLTAANPVMMNANCTTRVDHSTLLGDRWHECYMVSSAVS